MLVGGHLDVTSPHIVLEGCYLLLSDIVFKSILLEGEMLDIESAIFSECTRMIVMIPNRVVNPMLKDI